MTKQWGDNPEYTIDIWCGLTQWALPALINWRNYCDVKDNKCFTFEIGILCFGFSLEIWRWTE